MVVAMFTHTAQTLSACSKSSQVSLRHVLLHHLQERRWRALGAHIARLGGVLSAEEMAPFLNPPPLRCAGVLSTVLLLPGHSLVFLQGL